MSLSSGASHRTLELVKDFLKKNGLIETCQTLEAELDRSSFSPVDCDLAQLVSASDVFNGHRPPGVHSVETRVVMFNPAKGDPYGSTSMPIYQTGFLMGIDV